MGILVIGNGFDVAHSLKTTYKDFIEMIKLIRTDKFSSGDLDCDKRYDLFNELADITKKNCFLNHFIRSSDIEDSWCGVEREIEKVIDVWIDILDKVTAKGKVRNWNSEMEFVMHSFSDFFETEDARTEKKERTLFRSEVYRELAGIYVTERGVNKSSIINELKIELNDLIKAFELYLQLFVETVTTDQCFELSGIYPEMVINFNYTKTHEIYKLFGNNDESNKSKVKYIHGKVGSEPNNIVMGMNVYGNDYNRDFVYFMKFFQRIQHRNDILKVNDLFELAKPKSSRKPFNNQKPLYPQNVHFVGHSMSNADGDVIRLLKSPVMETEEFEIESKFIIYYYNQWDYEQKVINLFEVFGKDETIQMIHDEEIVFLPLKLIMCKK